MQSTFENVADIKVYAAWRRVPDCSKRMQPVVGCYRHAVRRTTAETRISLPRDRVRHMGRWAMHDICPSVAKDNHIFIRVLHDACKALGGEHKLALHLRVEVELVERWLQGKSIPPDSIFLACLDIVQQGAPGP